VSIALYVLLYCLFEGIFNSSITVPQSVIIEGEEEWKVEKILNKRKVWGKTSF